MRTEIPVVTAPQAASEPQVRSSDWLGGTHRVMTDGLCYKVQRRIKRRFLWWMWEKWVDLGKLQAPHPRAWAVTYYADLEAAAKACEEMNRRDRTRHEWREVPPSESS